MRKYKPCFHWMNQPVPPLASFQRHEGAEPDIPASKHRLKMGEGNPPDPGSASKTEPSSNLKKNYPAHLPNTPLQFGDTSATPIKDQMSVKKCKDDKCSNKLYICRLRKANYENWWRIHEKAAAVCKLPKTDLWYPEHEVVWWKTFTKIEEKNYHVQLGVDWYVIWALMTRLICY